MRRLTAINFLDAFIASALAILVPLILLTRNVSVSEIGLILSALPLVFLFARMLFSAIADQAGYKPFFIIDWLAQALSIGIYFFAASPIAFLFGKMSEGVRASAFWAVVRTATFSVAKGREREAATRLSGFRTAGAAVGTALAGIFAAFFGLHYALVMLAAVALLQGFPALTLRGNGSGRFTVKKTASLLMPFGKGKAFWLTALAMGLYALASYPIFYLVAPVLMRLDLGLGYDSIGYVVAAYYLLNTLGTFAGMRLRLSFTKVALLQAAIYSLAASLIALTGSSLFVPLFLIMALGEGFSLVMFEGVIAKATKGKPSVSTDIGFLHVPFRIAEFISVIFAGFAFQYLGYPVIFAIAAFSFAAYSYIGWRLLRN